MTIDHYAECELAVAKLLANLTDIFKVGAVTQGNYAVLDRGFDRCAVIIPGSFTGTKRALGSALKDYQWSITVDIFQRYQQPDKAFGLFKEMRSAVIEQIDSHPLLTLEDVQIHGIIDSSVQSGGEPTFISKEGTNVYTHLTQSLSVTVIQLVELTGSDFS